MKRERTAWLMAALVFVAAVLWFGSSTTPASEKPTIAPAKVAVVDASKVFTEYEYSKKANDDLRKTQEQIEAKMKGMRTQVEDLKADLGNFNPQSKDFYDRQEKLMKLQVEFDVYGRLKIEQTTRKMGAMTGQIYDQILKAVKEIGEEDGYDLILYSDQIDVKLGKLAEVRSRIMQRKVLYVNSRIDITDKVLKRLNDAYSKKGK